MNKLFDEKRYDDVLKVYNKSVQVSRRFNVRQFFVACEANLEKVAFF